jgi:endoglucanase
MKSFWGTLCLLLLLGTAITLSSAQSGDYHAWWNDQHPGAAVTGPARTTLPLIHVNGSQFVDEKGDTVIFHGMAISDPDKVEHQGQWNKSLFQHVKDLGANVVRIPIHPIAWRERTAAGYLVLLDQAVEWCSQLGMYVMIDWHSIGNLGMGLYQDPMYNTTKTETYEFWRTIARHFQGHHTPIFYEIFNEPTLYRGTLGSMSWNEWKGINEKVIRLIRAFDTEKIPLVAGLDWAYDLTPLADDPLDIEGIAYVVHPYPHKRTPPYEPKWEENFGFAASKYPVFATEFSFTLGDEGIRANGAYGAALVSYLEAKRMSWVGWVYDPEWTPRVITSWKTHELTECGRFFKEALQRPSTSTVRGK